jgi:hypothetical protein
MNQSEQINEVAAALAVAQGQFVNPPRNREVEVKMKAGGTYTFAYATLDSIMDVVRGPLAENGLAICHSLGTDDQGPICLTRLVHKSGQWLETWMPVIVSATADAQNWGSAVTYAKRNGLCALLAICADTDDDGNSACGNEAAGKDRFAPPRANAKTAAEDKTKKSIAAMRTAFEQSATIKELVSLLDAAKAAHPTETDLILYGEELLEGKIIVASKSVEGDNIEKLEKVRATYLPKSTLSENAIKCRREELSAAV